MDSQFANFPKYLSMVLVHTNFDDPLMFIATVTILQTFGTFSYPKSGSENCACQWKCVFVVEKDLSGL